MRKLKLESLIVESFETSIAADGTRGTVRGAAGTEDTGLSMCQICMISDDWRCQTDSPEVCGDTNYLDCTFVCSDFASCQTEC
jgi:hypothetical protein